MEELKGKLVFVQTAGGESVVPTSGVIGVVEEITPDFVKLKEAGVFALVPTTKGAQATIMPLDPTANEPVEAYLVRQQIVAIVPVGERSRLKEFHQQFKAAAAGIELPSANAALELSKLKDLKGNDNKGGLQL
jgi:preprotein translocase subunit YajC